MLSICIVNYNNKALLQDCLKSIERTAADVPHETIVVDNASQDGSAGMVRERFPRAAVLVSPNNAGYGAALNQAIRRSRGDRLLFLNEDVEIRPGAIRTAVDFINSRSDAGIVGCRILDRNGETQRSCRSFPTPMNLLLESFYLDKLFPNHRWFGRPYLSHFRYDSVREVDVVLGAFMMVKRETVRDTGGFDERFFMYSDESDFCLRARRAGWKTLYCPDAGIVHLGGESTKSKPGSYFIELHKSHHRFIRKHHGLVALAAAKAVLLGGVWIRFVVHSVRLVLQGTGLASTMGADVRSSLHKYFSTLGWYLKTGLFFGS